MASACPFGPEWSPRLSSPSEATAAAAAQHVNSMKQGTRSKSLKQRDSAGPAELVQAPLFARVITQFDERQRSECSLGVLQPSKMFMDGIYEQKSRSGAGFPSCDAHNAIVHINAHARTLHAALGSANPRVVVASAVACVCSARRWRYMSGYI
eukprot:6198673-Pleurochrysis_carterae.AAC.2